jgi:hypothetical protein
VKRVVVTWEDCIEACHKREAEIRKRFSPEDIESLRSWAAREGLSKYHVVREWLHEEMGKKPYDDPLDWPMLAPWDNEMGCKVQLLVVLNDTIHSRKVAESMRASGFWLPCATHKALHTLSVAYSELVGERPSCFWPFDDLSPFSVHPIS